MTGVFYASLIFLGYFYLHGYYKQFGISISQSASFTDVLLSFMPAISRAGIIVFMYLLLAYAVVQYMKRFGYTRRIHDWRSKITERQFSRISIATGAGIIIVPVLDAALEDMEWYRVHAVLYGVIMIVVIFILIWIFVVTLFKSMDTLRLSSIMTIVSCTFISSALVGVRYGQYDRRYKNDERVTITTATDTITTNDHLMFVGQVSTALFLYDRMDSSSTVIPMDEVKRIRRVPIGD